MLCRLEKSLHSSPDPLGGPSDVWPSTMPEAFCTVGNAGEPGGGKSDASVTAPTHVALHQVFDRSPTKSVVLVSSVTSRIAILLSRKNMPSPSTPGSVTPNTPT